MWLSLPGGNTVWVAVPPVLSLPPEVAAPYLLGGLLTVSSPEGAVTLRLVEVEAYAGERDPASHAFRGLTSRTAPMFGPPGTVYVYRSYGMHWCLNLVSDAPGVASGILLRAGEVVSGVELAASRRAPGARLDRLASGPGNLGAALGVSGVDSGSVLGGRITLEVPAAPLSGVLAGPRVGISRAAERPWRFALLSPALSASRASLAPVPPLSPPPVG